MQITESLPVDKIRFLLREESNRLPEDVLSLIYSGKLFKMFVPKDLGGLQLSLPDAVELLADCAYADGSFGWAVQIGAGGGYFTAFLSDEIIRDYVKKPEFVIAGSGFPGGRAIRKDGGYLISDGFWKYCSGSQYATLFTANCQVEGTDTVKAFAFRPDQVTIIPGWSSYGMQATSSDNMTVDGLFLDDEKSFDLNEPRKDYGYPVHQFPFLLFAEVVICATLQGCFRHLVENASELAQKNLSDDLTAEIARAHTHLHDCFTTFTSLVDSAWKKAMQNELHRDQRLMGDLSASIRKTTRTLFRSASNLFFFGGMPVTSFLHPFNRTWRDFTTICQHVLIK